MQVLSRSVLRLIRSPNVATAPAPVHCLSCHPWWDLLCFIASAPPALARRVFPIMAAPSSPVRRVSRSPHGYQKLASGIGVKGEELGKPDRRLLIPSAHDIMISMGECATQQFVACYGDGRPAQAEGNEKNCDDDPCRTILEVIDGKRDTPVENLDISDSGMDSDGEEADGVFPLYRLPGSRHRDGSLYGGGKGSWRKSFRVTDPSETRLEAMKLSDPPYCGLGADGICMWHPPRQMLQIFSLKVAKIHVDGGSAELYGYIAARDGVDRLLNHVINFSRDDPIIVEQGSFISMTGPKRGIELLGTILIEYDMRIKTGKHAKDDLQLIDGVSIIDDMDNVERYVFKGRIRGECGAIDVAASRINYAVEATVEVTISEVYTSFNLYVGCFTSGLQEEIQLFDGVIGESRELKRSVVHHQAS